jgi:hypothetical protein
MVLVIIGLILGAVFVGQSLVEAAQMRAVIKQIESYNTAVNTFRPKYNGLPGDLANAHDYWAIDANCVSGHQMTGASTCDGNGDGIIGGCSESDPPANQWRTNFNEAFELWNQLALAGLIPGTYSPGPVCGAGRASPITVPTCGDGNIATSSSTAALSRRSQSMICV